jgi:hypothetical protein
MDRNRCHLNNEICPCCGHKNHGIEKCNEQGCFCGSDNHWTTKALLNLKREKEQKKK